MVLGGLRMTQGGDELGEGRGTIGIDLFNGEFDFWGDDVHWGAEGTGGLLAEDALGQGAVVLAFLFDGEEVAQVEVVVIAACCQVFAEQGLRVDGGKLRAGHVLVGGQNFATGRDEVDLDVRIKGETAEESDVLGAVGVAEGVAECAGLRIGKLLLVGHFQADVVFFDLGFERSARGVWVFGEAAADQGDEQCKG